MKRYDTRPLKSAQPFKHSRTCAAAQAEAERVTLANGQVLHRCPTCGGFGVPAGEYQEPAKPVIAPTPLQWRCGRHIDRRVDGRGRGCPDCVTEHKRRIGERIRRRTEAQDLPDLPTL